MKRESFRKGMKDGVPIGLGYFAVSFTFGMMAVAGGLSIWQAVLISLTNLTSAGQFAGLDIIFAGGSMWEMAMTQLIINLRYCLMSFSLSQKFRREESGILKYIAAFGITDEIFGISAAQEGKVSVFYNYGAMAVSTIFAVTPVLKQVSSGFMIIITTLLVAGLAAYFCPVEEKEEAAHES